MNRREFLGTSIAAAAISGLPTQTPVNSSAPLPDLSLLESDTERYWRRIRKEQFLLPNWRVFLNNGTLGVAPKCDHIYARIHHLARVFYDRASRYPYIEMLTPDDHRLYAGLVSIRFKKDASPAWEIMRQRRIWTKMGSQTRVSTHIHTRVEDIDEFFGILEETLGKA